VSTRTYGQCGLRIRSEFPLDLPVLDDSEWDLDVRWGHDIGDTTGPPEGEVIVQYSSDPESWYTATWTGSTYLFRFRNCGEFVISADLRHVLVRRDRRGERQSLLPVLVAGTLAALVLTLRGRTVLHSSAVAVHGGTLSFVGVSGKGKTTMAALMCAHGCPLVADDLLIVEPSPPVTSLGGAHELRLRPAAAALFSDHPTVTRRVTVDGRTAVAPRSVDPAPRPLSAIVIPTPSRDTDRLTVEQLPPSTAMIALLASPRVHGWAEPTVLMREFGVLGTIADSVPVYEAVVPWGPPFDPSVAAELLNRIGLSK
jgi:hypothetical protein